MAKHSKGARGMAKRMDPAGQEKGVARVDDARVLGDKQKRHTRPAGRRCRRSGCQGNNRKGAPGLQEEGVAGEHDAALRLGALRQVPSRSTRSTGHHPLANSSAPGRHLAARRAPPGPAGHTGSGASAAQHTAYACNCRSLFLARLIIKRSPHKSLRWLLLGEKP